jgi:tRNA modification GTPase
MPAGRPGEFTQRAFLNGRMDLSQAEAVMDLISARSERALAAAQQVLRGALGRHMAALVDGVLGRAGDRRGLHRLPGRGPSPGGPRQAPRRAVAASWRGTEQLLATERTGALLREGIATVILGEPNAGKSSLLNRMVGCRAGDRQPRAGTTRDFIEERSTWGPHGLRLVDTAGLNPAPRASRLGVEKTLERAARADLFSSSSTRPAPPRPSRRGRTYVSLPSNTLVVLNKADLLGRGGRRRPCPPPGFPAVAVSALTGDGLEGSSRSWRLADGLQTTVGEERIAINVRHAHYLAEARACLAAALAKIAGDGPAELLASDLRGALSAFGEISGKVDNERMLDQLFASFCIGK